MQCVKECQRDRVVDNLGDTRTHFSCVINNFCRPSMSAFLFYRLGLDFRKNIDVYLSMGSEGIDYTSHLEFVYLPSRHS